jgi:ankyrin repeat protein
LKVAELLIKYGVNTNHLDMNGQTCLFYAAREGQLEMCKFLINRGCRHDLLDKSKKMPLHFAKTYKHPSVIEYLASLKEVSKSRPTKWAKTPVEAKV